MDRLQREQAVGDFTARHGISWEAVDSGIFNGLAGLFSKLVPFAVFVTILAACLRKGAAVKHKPIIGLLYAAGAVLSFAAFLYMCRISLTIPHSMVPNRWSDFEFWTRTWNAYFADLNQIMTMPKETPEIQYFAPLMKTVGFSLLAVVCFGLSAIGWKIDSFPKLFGFVGASLVLGYMVILAAESGGLLPDQARIVWGLYPYFLAGKYITEASFPKINH